MDTRLLPRASSYVPSRLHWTTGKIGLVVLVVALAQVAAGEADGQERSPSSQPSATIPTPNVPGTSPPLTIPRRDVRQFDTRSKCAVAPVASPPTSLSAESKNGADAALRQIPDAHRNDLPATTDVAPPPRHGAVDLGSSGSLLFAAANGDAVLVRLAGVRNAVPGRVDLATTMTPNAFPGIDVMHQRSAIGSARTLLVINESSAQQEFRFDLSPVCSAGGNEAKSELRLHALVTGAVQVDIATGPETHGLLTVAPPWAVDATGRAVPTGFSVEGTTLIQTVDTSNVVFPVLADPTYWINNCQRYTSDGSARSYVLNHDCPVWAMFRSVRGYNAVLAYESAMSAQFGYVAARQDGSCSPPATDTGPWWDFAAPCRAHDYCYDLIRAGFGGVYKVDCDSLFYDLMLAHCNNRPSFSDACKEAAIYYYTGVQTVSVQPYAPRSSLLVAQHSGKCADVYWGSLQPGGIIGQYACHYQANQKFVIRYTGATPIDYSIEAVNSGMCLDVRNFGNDSAIQQWNCFSPRPSNQLWWVRGFGDQNQYTFRPKSSGWANCLDVPGSSTGNVGLIQYPCHEFSNQRWAITYIG